MLSEIAKKFDEKIPVTPGEISHCIEHILEGNARHEDLLRFLASASPDRLTGEQVAEAAQVMRAQMKHVPGLEAGLDNCGTGGSIHKTYNISSAAALVLAALRVKIAKHGNRSTTRPSGSGDFFANLGYTLDGDESAAHRDFSNHDLAFLFAPQFHPAVRHAAAARRELGTPTIFNLLGPLCNPASVQRQVVGVGNPSWAQTMASASLILGTNRTLIIHGAPGFDEATPAGIIHMQIVGTDVEEMELNPRELGVNLCSPAELRPQSAPLSILKEALSGRGSKPLEDTLALNVALGLWCKNQTKSLASQLECAQAAIQDGLGNDKWDAILASHNRRSKE